jgi:hypothetical protein
MSYEICLIEKSTFKKFSFEYIVIDEVHHIKNIDSVLGRRCGRQETERFAGTVYYSRDSKVFIVILTKFFERHPK